MKHFFLHPKTLKVCGIYKGRSLWEDHIDKADFVVVKVVGPAMEHWEEAMKEAPSENVIDDIRTSLSAIGYGDKEINRVISKLQE